MHAMMDIVERAQSVAPFALILDYSSFFRSLFSATAEHTMQRRTRGLAISLMEE